MEEIQVGEYVRTKKGSIGKFNFYGVDNELVYFKNNKGMTCVTKNEIVKHSEFIEELIEIGDYVNGHKVEVIWEDADNYRFGGCDYMFQITGEEIKSIVTKEQFESFSYKLED